MTPPALARQADGASPRLLDALVEALAPERLDAAVPAALWERALGGPLLDFARRPGKELRARLAELAWLLAGGRGPVPPPVPLVVEGLHAGSLIVDDVQDDARERRGAPALHVVAGVPVAINSGNWLYFWALAQLDQLDAAPVARARMHQAAVATLLACHQGQALDLTVRAHELDPARAPAVVAAITRGKTAALMGLGPRLAALTAGADDERAALLARLGEDLGTGLQMLDDLGGLGRARRAKGLEDLRGGRATWPWAWLALTTDHLAYVRLQHRARAGAERADDDELEAVAEALRAEIDAHGRAAAHALIHDALARTRVTLGDSATLTALAAEARRLEESYG
ncbi:MAG: polyprenyl synthetase family protein [Kofleriaceae bacterium]|nr:polyprenyl synthetase family protein [Kofleriaceae bacterium]MCL4228699.1 polyprenyl synthetase family protein [Myxococcales bacterium]